MFKDAELKQPINVKYIKDEQGREWICYSDVAKNSDFQAAGCVLANEIDFDRMFGG